MGNVLTDGNGNVLISNNNALEVTSSIDSNVQPENIKKGVTILGVTGTYEGGTNSSPIALNVSSSSDFSNPIIIQRWLEMWDDIESATEDVNIYKYFTFCKSSYNSVSNRYDCSTMTSLTVDKTNKYIWQGRWYYYYNEQSNQIEAVYDD